MRSLNGGVSRIESVVAEVFAENFRRLKRSAGKRLSMVKRMGTEYSWSELLPNIERADHRRVALVKPVRFTHYSKHARGDR